MASLADILKGSSQGPGAGEDDAGDTGSSDYDASGQAAMRDFISALASKDAAGAWEALKTAVDLCGHDDGGEGGSGSMGGKGGHALLLVPHGK